VVTAYRPDPVVDPNSKASRQSLARFRNHRRGLPELAGLSCRAPPAPRLFAQHGATSTDHGHPTAQTANLSAPRPKPCSTRWPRHFTAQEAELFRAQMLTEMAAMSLEDGLVMQIHPGSFRNHNQALFEPSGATRAPTSPPAPIMSTR
jgi:glucuronate isomerase